MSTRCQIGFYKKKEDKIEDFQVLLYRHTDGYPEGILPDIVPFLKWWKDQRGIDDYEYCSARLLQHLCNLSDSGPALRTAHILNKNTDFTGIYSHGVCNQFHGDIDYIYKVYPNTVEVYEVHYKWSNDYKEQDAKYKLIKTIEI